jgi:sialate O-acetylesterase
MQDWRRSFGDALPFLVVQLAGYGPRSTAPAESGTARLREAQRQAVAADPHAALAVAVDLGEPGDIHPANKQDVARRLARAARHLIYGEAISPSGPQPGLASREGETVVVTLREVEGDLRTYGSAHPIGFELCAAGSCRYAEGTVRGTTVVLDDGDLRADTVRFCWADSPVCNLYDAAGLPVVPFETRIGQGAR